MGAEMGEMARLCMGGGYDAEVGDMTQKWGICPTFKGSGRAQPVVFLEVPLLDLIPQGIPCDPQDPGGL